MDAIRRRPAESSMKAGFTLVELSIVLVIIGLIIGGVLVGAVFNQRSRSPRPDFAD